MRKLRFTKMHGAGNDFIVIDGTTHDLSQLDSSLWHRLAHRQLGVGADQILLVEKSSKPGVDFKYRIFNADGGEVEQCGNGSRCFVRFVHEQGLSTRMRFKWKWLILFSRSSDFTMIKLRLIWVSRFLILLIFHLTPQG